MRSAATNLAQPVPMPIIGELSNARRWELICDGIAEQLSEGDRAGRGLPLVRFRLLPPEEQAVYQRAALEAVQRFACPELCEDARDAAILRACQVWQGDPKEPIPIPPWLAVRMRKAVNGGLAHYHAALDGTSDPFGVAERASELALLIAPQIGRTVQS